MTDTTLFTNGLFLDVERGTYREGDLRVDDGVIREAGPALRACITNYRTGPEDIEALVAALARARSQQTGESW